MRTLVPVLALAAFALSGAPIVSGQSAAPPLPARLGEYIARHVRLTATQHTQLLQGLPITRLLDADPSKEVSVFGVVWIKAPMSRYLEAVKDIEQFEKGENFLITKRISAPPRLDDFAAMRLQPDDARDLRKCKVGSCAIKLSEGSLLRLRKEVDWSKPEADAQVEALFRRLALEYVNGYLEGGNARLAAYRDSSRPTFVGHEFKAMVDQMPSLTEFLPDVKAYLLEFPGTKLANSESILYWQEAKFGLKPTIRVNHLAVAERPNNAVVVSKMLYASHYFWTAIELRVLVPDPARGEGFWFANVSRSRSDGLSGFVGTMIRGKVRGEAEKGMLAALKLTKAKLEGQ
jgi:hypothetical protein